MASRGHDLSAISERYAGALFELAQSNGELDTVDAGLSKFMSLVRESSDLRRLIDSPLFSPAQQEAGLAGLLDKAGITGIAHNFLLMLAKNRRLTALAKIAEVFQAALARDKGELPAEIVSAMPLSQDQQHNLADILRQNLGKTPKMAMRVDPALLGGLVVRVGSQMIDTSIRTKLKTLQIAMKEPVR